MDDGIVMAQDLRKEGFFVPILMVSGIGQVTGLHYSEDKVMVPVEAFLEKPIKPDVLMTTIRKLLNVQED